MGGVIQASHPSWGMEIYVDANHGDDRNDGSPQRPLRTFDGIPAVITENLTVHMRGDSGPEEGHVRAEVSGFLMIDGGGDW
jgi:hypothetical protein